MSFVANMFRGEVEASQLFPYPYALNEEQRENIAMFIDPVTSFFTVSKCELFAMLNFCFLFFFAMLNY